VTDGVRQAFAAAIEALRSLGAAVVDVALPHAGYGIAAYYVITPSEISANLARYDGLRYGYQAPGAATLAEVYTKSRGRGLGSEAKRRIMLGTYALSHGYYDAYYLTAQRVRTVIARELDDVLARQADVIATPTSPHVALKVGEKVDDPLAMYLEDIFMSPAALAGLPAMSLPCGFARPEGDDAQEELPVGLQLIGRRFDEATLLSVGHVFEQATPWHARRPAL
jgi:aspartyl-tRNA(Asn)/glutamyl-tRNA(Gln) amidotransferase subunit A